MVGDEIPLARAATAAEKEEKHSLPADNPSNQQPSKGGLYALHHRAQGPQSATQRGSNLYALCSGFWQWCRCGQYY